MEVLVALIAFVAFLAVIVGLVMLIPKSKRKLGIKIFFTGVIVFIISFTVIINVFVEDEETTDNEAEPASTEVKQDDKTISKAQYESVKIGESQEKVQKDLGKVSEGNISEIAEGTQWTYSSQDLGLAYFLFSKNGKTVIKKSELGLLSEGSNTETTKDGTIDKNNWNEQVKSIALSDKSKTEKFDEVSKLASDYSLSDSELNEFQNYIVNEYKSKNYLKDINNDEYMLANIFKSTAVEKNYDDSEQNPADAFAFDFLQNTKYTYRGVDSVDSDAVKSNEHQMDKSLAQLQ